jgi:hypothetical protein
MPDQRRYAVPVSLTFGLFGTGFWAAETHVTARDAAAEADLAGNTGLRSGPDGRAGRLTTPVSAG